MSDTLCLQRVTALDKGSESSQLKIGQRIDYITYLAVVCPEAILST